MNDQEVYQVLWHLQQIVGALPSDTSKLTWLDPALERGAKELIKTHGHLLKPPSPVEISIGNMVWELLTKIDMSLITYMTNSIPSMVHDWAEESVEPDDESLRKLRLIYRICKAIGPLGRREKKATIREFFQAEYPKIGCVRVQIRMDIDLTELLEPEILAAATQFGCFKRGGA